jgi:two-component system CheB/CheR fusion protein
MDEETREVEAVATAVEEDGRQDGEAVALATAVSGREAEASGQVAADDSLYVVGIGASAGGLNALQRFFAGMPADSGMAFVVVTHLSPEHVSHMPGLIQPHTAMPVAEVPDVVHMEANRVYVIPPNRQLSAIDTHLRLSATDGAKQRPVAPIDYFFRTLAEAKGERAIGIILSGTGTDGSLGIKQIKERGGLTMVQQPEEAEFDGMPQSAIGTGLVDVVLPVREMPLHLAQFVQARPQLPVTSEGEPATERVQDVMQKIMAQLRAHTGHDFGRYKGSTLTRRIRRRMQIQRVGELGDYLQLLRGNRDEVQALFKDLLITVTNFFRDREAFQFLEEEVASRLLAGKTIGDQVRVWSVGCATGEEAYSLAMVLLEQTDQMDYAPTIQIFASDISEEALARAREGVYPEAIAADVAPERLRRFFQKEPGGYRVKKEVREMVLFAPHDLLKDPPFSRIDLIACRNLLIYLKREAQRQVFELFHYALRPNGYLFLGPSEAIEGAELFRETSKRHSIYQTVATAEIRLPSLPLSLPGRSASGGQSPERREMVSPGNIHRRMLERYAAPSILVNGDYNIIHLSEGVGRYLQQPGGEPTNNVLRRVLPAFRVELTTMLYGAFKKDRTGRAEGVRLMVAGQACRVTMSVYPAREVELEGFALIVFEESEEPSGTKELPEPLQTENTTIQALAEELEQTRRRLQTTIEEFETSKEEMKAANEELQSINEELRSTAEELETSKEELQSMNEELITLNQENKNKVEELSQLTADLQNLLAGTDIATLFLDRELRIKRFTPKVNELFNILASDRGRPLAHLTHRLGQTNLLEDANTVLINLAPLEREVQSEAGAWYLTRLLPYRTIEDRIDGVVVTFVAITELKRAQNEAQRRAQQQATVAMLGRLAVEGTEPETLFERAMQQVREALNVEYVELLEVEGEGDGGRVLAESNGGNGAGTAGKVDSRSAVLYTVQTGEPVLVADWNEEKRFRLRPSGVEPRIRSSATVMAPGTRPSRVLAVHSATARAFHEDDIRFLQGVANLLAEATERKAFEEQLQALNETLEERVEERTAQVRALASELLFTEQQVRQRVSQVLHDDLQQLLFATQVHVQILKQGVVADPPVLAEGDVEEVKGMIDEALQLTRRLTIDLSPPVLRSEDLAEALRWLAGHFKEMHGLAVELVVESLPEEMNHERRLLIFQMIKELLFNVVKHAAVKEAQVRVGVEGDNVMVQVMDEGEGFDVARVLAEVSRTGSYGLGNMHERLGLLGGRMEIESERGKGTTVTAVIPQTRE